MASRKYSGVQNTEQAEERENDHSFVWPLNESQRNTVGHSVHIEYSSLQIKQYIIFRVSFFMFTCFDRRAREGTVILVCIEGQLERSNGTFR
jgi:hypothetical protein